MVDARESMYVFLLYIFLDFEVEEELMGSGRFTDR